MLLSQLSTIKDGLDSRCSPPKKIRPPPSSVKELNAFDSAVSACEQKIVFSGVLKLLNLLGDRNLLVVTRIRAPKCLNVFLL